MTILNCARNTSCLAASFQRFSRFADTLFTNVNLVITQKHFEKPKVRFKLKILKVNKDFLKLFANRMVIGILSILQSVEKDVDCPTHRKSLTLDWSEAVTDIFQIKAETDSTVSTVSIITFFSVWLTFQVLHISYASPDIQPLTN